MANQHVSEGAMRDTTTAKASRDVPQERQCLRCITVFWSEGFGERICRRCKGLRAWRTAIPDGPGTSRRR